MRGRERNKSYYTDIFVFQVVSNRDTQETLLCLAFVFEVCSNDDGPKHHVYRLIKSGTN